MFNPLWLIGLSFETIKIQKTMKETDKKHLHLISLAICILILAWSYIDLNKRHTALEKANQSLENDLLELNKTNETLIEKLEAETFQVEEREERIAALENKLDQLKEPIHEDVNSIPDNDVDRIYELLSKYYPR